MQKLHASFEELHSAGCIQTGADIEDVGEARRKFLVSLMGLMSVTKGYPCNGCPEEGKCEAQHRYTITLKHQPVEENTKPKIKRRRTTYIGTRKQRCPQCKLKIRGANHHEHCRPR